MHVARKHQVVTVLTTFETVGTGVRLAVDLHYDTRNPFGAQIRFPAVAWTVARDLLDGGLLGPSGLGDVRIRPLPGDQDRTLVEFASPTGHALFAVRTTVLADFLWQTYEAVPPETELTWVDLDGAVSGLLGDPAA
jgi:hypothetical protein